MLIKEERYKPKARNYNKEKNTINNIRNYEGDITTTIRNTFDSNIQVY